MLGDGDMRGTSDEPRGSSLSVEVRVRYAECDSFGYLHHAKHWEYFEYARMELLRSRGVAYRDLEADGVFFVVVEAQCRYLRPLRYDDLALVTVTTTGVGHSRVKHRYEIHHNEALTCRASTTLGCVDQNGRPRAMPDGLWVDRRSITPHSDRR